MPKSKGKKKNRKKRGNRVRTAVTRVSKPLPRVSGSLPSAYARQIRARFSVKHSRTGVRVCGVDLVQSLPEVVEYNNTDFLFAALPCSPVYWAGTRVAALAAAYQNYRPIKWKAHFVPQVAVTTPGTVICGTIWHTPTSTMSFQQTLVTSNGGMMSQCYVPFTTTVRLGTNLTQNLFGCAGNMGPENNPFFFMAMMRGSSVIPGYFFVEYEFELKNPLGQSVTYTVERSLYPDTGLPANNKSILTLGAIPGYSGPGLTLDVESDGKTLYNGSDISIPSGVAILVFTNSPFEITINNRGFVGSIVVTNQEAMVGEYWPQFITRVGDYARYNAATDENRQSGYFSQNGALGFGFERISDGVKEYISMFVERLVPQVTKLFVYAFDFGVNAIGELIAVVVPTVSSRLEPLLTLSLFTDDGFDHKRRPASELLQFSELWGAKSSLKKTKKTRLVSLEETDSSS